MSEETGYAVLYECQGCMTVIAASPGQIPRGWSRDAGGVPWCGKCRPVAPKPVDLRPHWTEREGE